MRWGPSGSPPDASAEASISRRNQIGVVVVVDALQHRGDALEPHPRIDRRFGQVDPFVRCNLLVLHEHQVPDLDEAVAVRVGAPGRPTGNFFAVIVKDFGTGAARAGVAHRPKIIAGWNPHDLLVGQARDPLPQIEGDIVLGIDRSRETVGCQAHLLGYKCPGEFDR